MENLKLCTKTIRVSYCDPDATDSSSDDESDNSHENSKRKVHEIEVEFVQKNQNEGTGFKKPNLTSLGEKMVGIRKTKSGKFWAEIKDPIKKRWVWLGVFGTAEGASRAYLAEKSKIAAAELRAKQPVPKTAGNKLLGVRKRKSGKFSAEIRNPIIKRRVWLGTFDTEEEASRAYLDKKAHFEAEKLRDKRRLERVASEKSTIQDSVSSFHEGARTRVSGFRRRNLGKFWAEIANPITKRNGSFATEEEASRAYLAKEAELENDLRAKQGFGRVASEKSSATDSVSSDLSNETVGENKVSRDQEAEFGFFNGVQVVDKNGFLVGEFSMLDDLSIFSTEEGANS